MAKSPEQVKKDSSDAWKAIIESNLSVAGTAEAMYGYFRDHPHDVEGIKEAASDLWDAMRDGTMGEYWGEAWQELKDGFDKLVSPDDPTESPTDEPADSPDEGPENPTDEPADSPDEGPENPTDEPVDSPDEGPEPPTDEPVDSPDEGPGSPSDEPTDSPDVSPEPSVSDPPSPPDNGADGP